MWPREGWAAKENAQIYILEEYIHRYREKQALVVALQLNRDSIFN